VAATLAVEREPTVGMPLMNTRRPSAFGLSIDPDQLLPAERYPFGLGPDPKPGDLPEPARRVAALARALVSSPVWADMQEAIAVVRTEPPEGIAFLGYFSEQDIAHLHWLSAQLQAQLPHLRHVSWSQAEADAELLAARLRDHFGHRTLGDFRFVAIPRGGLIVLGMLSYALGLDSRALGPPPEGRGPVVVVDDCALSGLRFAEFLRTRVPGTDEVVFAHLYSHPRLRQAIEAREPRVSAAIAARDLRDLAPVIHGEALEEWRSRWQKRNGERAYWVGQPEHVAFAWSEPDSTFWDELAGSARAGWRLVPPEACLKNRHGSSDARGLQVQIPAEGAMRLAPGTFHGELNGRILVAELASGQVISLSGVAADLWREFLQPGDPCEALRRLEARYEVPLELLRSDAEKFLRSLLARGVLTAVPRFDTAPAGENQDG
jgi:hypothetical protein